MFIRKKIKSTKNREDSELLTLYQESRDSFYLGELFQRYTHLVFGTCMKYLQDREDARDMVMQVFEKLLVEVLNYEIRNFGAWLHVLTRNHCLMYLRQHKSREVQIEQYQFWLENNGEPGEENNEPVLAQLVEGVQQLPEEQRKCVELFYLQKKSYAEIAGITGFDMKSVKSYIQNGKRNLKIMLTRDNGKY